MSAHTTHAIRMWSPAWRSRSRRRPRALARGRARRTPPILSAVVFGTRYRACITAMEGLRCIHASAPRPRRASTDLLAIVVAIAAFGVSAIFLLFWCRIMRGRARVPPALRIRADLPPGLAGGGRRQAAVAAPAEVEAPELGRGGYAPLGGAGGPPRKFARHLPIERDGGTQFVAVEDVVAIHANAHYTTIFNGQEKLFCPLAIGDVEQRLDNRFVRVHRSHIVNITRVVGHRRSGDNELIEMDADHYAVPVSRSRIGSLKSRVAALNGSRRRHHLAAQ